MAKGEYLLPYFKGNMLSYDDSWMGKIEWRKNTVFEATLVYVTYERGRSAARLIFKDEHGHRYPMFLQQFDEIMSMGGFDGNRIHGEWVGVKRGANYGIQLYRHR